ncbi:phage tail protein [Vibrio hannami]|uniref:phage tail-collar fiber domain-containing protein n=1 Tax=Vibrio hannami TaxID=2717094 RepID=UPI00240ECB8C|nr:phage tail protein [Vibrio hannami]MDG3089130.1 phage tail protein [Vibrio hannami]
MSNILTRDVRCYLTNAGRAAELNAIGSDAEIRIVKMVIDGHLVPDDGDPKAVDTVKTPISVPYDAMVSVDEATGTLKLIADIPANHGGFVINGVAWVLEDGTVYAYSRAMSDVKPSADSGQASAVRYECEIVTQNASVITHTYDASQLYATHFELAEKVSKTGNEIINGIKQFAGNLVALGRLWFHGGNGQELGFGGTHDNPHHVIEANAGGGNVAIRAGHRVSAAPDFELIATEAGRPWAINISNDSPNGGFAFQVASDVAAVNDVLTMETVFALEPDSATFNYPVHAPAPTQASHLTRRDWVEENFVDKESTQDISGNKKFKSQSLELSSHWFNDLYNGTNKNYIHLYPNGGHETAVYTEFRYWNGTTHKQAIVVDGEEDSVSIQSPRALDAQSDANIALTRRDYVNDNFLSKLGGTLTGALRLIADNTKLLALRKKMIRVMSDGLWKMRLELHDTYLTWLRVSMVSSQFRQEGRTDNTRPPRSLLITQVIKFRFLRHRLAHQIRR